MTTKKQQLQSLYNSTTKRLITVYKTYLIYYGNWCKNNDLLVKYADQFKPLSDDNDSNNNKISDDDASQQNEDISNDDEAVIYKNLPISAQLIHQFLIENVIQKFKSRHNDDESITDVLSRWVNGFIFISKVCDIYGNLMIKRNKLDEDYLFNVIKLHTYGNDPTKHVPCYKISINAWNSNTKSLNSIIFKTANEKLKFLVDFHIATYLRLTFKERSQIRLCSFQLVKNKKIIFDTKYSNDLSILYYDASLDISSKKTREPVALLPHENPFLCPYTTLAASLFLRFYGIRYFSKGEGFPDLYDPNVVENLYLLSSKYESKYPKESLIGSYYSNMFKYCHVQYKKKKYFENLHPVYPTWISDSHFNQFEEIFPNDKVSWDYMNILNGYDPYCETTKIKLGIESNIPSRDIISSVFPEIEMYRGNWDQLPTVSKQLIKMLEVIRLKFVLDVPVIYKVFPEHDIFMHPIFKEPRLQYYLNGIQLQDHEPLPFRVKWTLDNDGPNESTLFKLYEGLVDQPSFLANIDLSEVNMNPLKLDINRSGSFNGDKSVQKQSDIPDILQFPMRFFDEPQKNNDELIKKALIESKILPNTNELLEQLRAENFKFIQFQTLYNFQGFIDLLSNLFGHLPLKSSSKMEIEKFMDEYIETLNYRLKATTPDDIKQYALTNKFVQKRDVRKKDIPLIELEDNGGNSDDDQRIPSLTLKTEKANTPFRIFSIGGHSSDEDNEKIPEISHKTKKKSKQSRHKNNKDEQDEGEKIEESSDDTSEDNGQSDQEEQLKDMIDELVTTKVGILLKRQMGILEKRMEEIVDSIIEAKLMQKIDSFIEHRVKRSIDEYWRQNESYMPPSKRVKAMESNFAQRVQNRTAALSLNGPTRTTESPTSMNSDYSITESTPVSVKNFQDNNSVSNSDNSNAFSFYMQPSIDDIQDIILEWFSPNPAMNNECVHSMDNKYGEAWRSRNDSLYQTRECIVDFYVYLTTIEALDNLQAIAYCKKLQGQRTIEEFSNFLKTYKNSHHGSFEGIYKR